MEPPILRSVRNPYHKVIPDLFLNLNDNIDVSINIVTESKINKPPKIRIFHIDPLISSLLNRRASFCVLILESTVNLEHSAGRVSAKTLLEEFREFKTRIFSLKLTEKQTNIIRGYYLKKGSYFFLQSNVQEIDEREILFKRHFSELNRRISSRVLESPDYNRETYRIICYLRSINRFLGKILFDIEITEFLSFIFSHETDLGLKYKEIVLNTLQDLTTIDDFPKFAEEILSDYTLALENFVNLIYQLCPELNPLLTCIKPDLSSLLIPKHETKRIRHVFIKDRFIPRKKIVKNKKPFYGLLVNQKWILELVYCRNKNYTSAKNPSELEKHFFELFNFLDSDSEFKTQFSSRVFSVEARSLAISILLRNYHHHKILSTILVADITEFKYAVNEISKSFLIIYKISLDICSK